MVSGGLALHKDAILSGVGGAWWLEQEAACCRKRKREGGNCVAKTHPSIEERETEHWRTGAAPCCGCCVGAVSVLYADSALNTRLRGSDRREARVGRYGLFAASVLPFNPRFLF
ncbi:hypothetical protein MRX96_049133 [Rhipicephalus microplus]